jgi:hypothetical protein
VKRLRYAHWVPFGWHGIRLDIPAEWNPGKIVGDRKSGSVRLDDATTIRMEIEWREAHGDNRITLIVDRFVEGLAKTAQKQKTGLHVERNAECPGLNLPDMHPMEYFIWESDARVYTLTCYSSASDRFLFLRIMGRPDEDMADFLARLFNSLEDSPPDGPHTWALFDLVFTSLPGYALESYDLKSGHLCFRFEQGRNTLQVDRLSLAKTLLKDRTHADWYRDFFRKDLRHLVFETEEATTAGHPGILVQGRPKSRWRALLHPLPFWHVRPRLHLNGRVWACPESNKIYAVQSYWKKADDAPDIEACCRNVLCHAETTQEV